MDNYCHDAGLARMLVKHNVTRLRRGSLCCGSQAGKVDNRWQRLFIEMLVGASGRRSDLPANQTPRWPRSTASSFFASKHRSHKITFRFSCYAQSTCRLR